MTGYVLCKSTVNVRCERTRPDEPRCLHFYCADLSADNAGSRQRSYWIPKCKDAYRVRFEMLTESGLRVSRYPLHDRPAPWKHSTCGWARTLSGLRR